MVFLSLFRYDFSIFPLIDRIYTDLKFNDNKTIAYYIYPSKDNHSETELRTITNTLNQFGLVSNISNAGNKILIFNIDFIPYLGKPSVILSSMTDDLNVIKSKIVKALGDKVDVLTDNDLFQGGKSVESLSSIFYGSNFNIVNMVLSYEFINDYNIFKTFVQSLI